MQQAGFRVGGTPGAASSFIFTADLKRQTERKDQLLGPSADLMGKHEARQGIKSQASGNEKKEEGLPANLQELLGKLETHLQKREPKPSKDIMTDINNYIWPDNISQSIDRLSASIGRYRFEDAQQALVDLFDITNDTDRSN